MGSFRIYLFGVFMLWENLLFCESSDFSLKSFSEGNKTAFFLDMSCQYLCSLNESIIENCDCSSASKQVISSWKTINITPKLLCKEADKIVLQTCNPNTSISYFIQSQNKFQNTWKLLHWSNSSCVSIINNLTENTSYRFRVWYMSASASSINFIPIITNYITTRKLTTPPKPVVNMTLQHYTYEYPNYKAEIAWEPSEEQSCHHEFVWFGGDDISDYTQLEIEIPYNFSITIDKLVFNSNYSVAIMTKNTDWSLESKKTWLHFNTPPCLEILHSLQYCVPLSPTGINTEESLSASNGLDEDLFNINISWDLPLLLPDYYILHLNAFRSESTNDQFLNISGTETNAQFTNVFLTWHYQITLFAYSPAGRSDSGEYYKEINSKDTVIVVSTDKISNNIFLLFLVPFVLFFCIISCIILGYKELTKRDQVIKRQRYFEELELKTHYLETPLREAEIVEVQKNDKWEIDSCCLKLQSVLGRGAFGLVRMGWLQQGDIKIAVAVKMLLDDHKQADVRDFRQEIEIMKSVGSHPHIVSLIGCSTKGKPEDLRLIVEYCARGDLLTYLRTAWDQITNQCTNIQNVNCDNKNQTNFDNKLYLLGLTETLNMQIKDLISIGLQIAMGMEHLSSLHVLHRDLAARNVLVCEDKTVKVSDFGLSRDVYRDNVYCKTSSGKLPVRWLALESLTHQVYTTQSDVWSYGILLWEIITLGSNPYPGIHTHELLDLLVKGFRMNCPSNCSQDLYNIMMNCWNCNPKDRPSFSTIREMLENILEHTSDYLNLNVCTSLVTFDADMKKLESLSTSYSCERYVKTFAL